MNRVSYFWTTLIFPFRYENKKELTAYFENAGKTLKNQSNPVNTRIPAQNFHQGWERELETLTPEEIYSQKAFFNPYCRDFLFENIREKNSCQTFVQKIDGIFLKVSYPGGEILYPIKKVRVHIFPLDIGVFSILLGGGEPEEKGVGIEQFWGEGAESHEKEGRNRGAESHEKEGRNRGAESHEKEGRNRGTESHEKEERNRGAESHEKEGRNRGTESSEARLLSLSAPDLENILKFGYLSKTVSPFVLGEELEDLRNCGRFPLSVSLVGREGEVLAEENFNSFEKQNIKIKSLNINEYSYDYISKIIIYFMGMNNKDKIHKIFEEGMLVYSYICMEDSDIMDDREFINQFTVYPLSGDINDKDIKEILDTQVLDRWKNHGTRLGFSNYSAMIVTNKNNPIPHNSLKSYYMSKYYMMAVLLYFYRSCLAVFSLRSAQCAEALKEEKNTDEDFKMTRGLKKDFLLFANKYWFSEITSLDQGIHIYNMWRKVIKIEELFSEMKYKVEELEQEVSSEIEKNTLENERNFQFITGIIAFFFLPISLLTGIYGMNIFEYKATDKIILDTQGFIFQFLLSVIFIMFVVLIIMVVTRLYKPIDRKIKKNLRM